MKASRSPSKVLITGGHEVGGVESFARALPQGFAVLGIPSEIIPLSEVFLRWRDLRDVNVLKSLSTSAVAAALIARRAICIAHGVPRADYQGWRKLIAIIGLFKVANVCSGVQLVSVSHYTAATLRAIFSIRTDAVVHNPVKPLYLEPFDEHDRERCYVTYVGRLIAAKNLGPGVDKDQLLNDLVRKYALQDVVSLLPASPNPYEYIRKASCVIMPSRYEGLPLVALESLAIGRPMIAADTDGLRDLVIDGMNGRLFPGGDARQLSACLVSTCQDYEKLSEYARNGPLSLEKCRASSVVGAWKTIALDHSSKSISRNSSLAVASGADQ